MTKDRKRKSLGLAALLLLVLVSVLFVIPFFWPWTVVNCWHEDLDIRSGRYRYQRFLLGLRVQNRVEETELSTLWREHLGDPGEPEWRRVNTFSPGRGNSPHYVHHSGLHNARKVVLAFDTTSFSDSAKAQALRTFFGLMQEHDRDDEAGNYANALLGLALERSEASPVRVVTEEDLPRADGQRSGRK